MAATSTMKDNKKTTTKNDESIGKTTGSNKGSTSSSTIDKKRKYRSEEGSGEGNDTGKFSSTNNNKNKKLNSNNNKEWKNNSNDKNKNNNKSNTGKKPFTKNNTTKKYDHSKNATKSSTTGTTGSTKFYGSNNTNSNKTTTTSNGTNTTVKVRKHADIVIEGKRLWNLLRVKSNTKETIRTIMTNELMPLLRPSTNTSTTKASTSTSATTSKIIKEICVQHDAARIVQAAIQFGTIKERIEIATDLVNDPLYFIELCKSQYGHYVILKLIKYCCTNSSSTNTNTHTNTTTKGKKVNKDIVALSLIETKITNILNGHVVKLAFHSISSRVIELIFTTPFSTKNLAVLKQELYGPHCTLLIDLVQVVQQTNQQPAVNSTSTSQLLPTLQSNLDALPDKYNNTMDYFRNLINKGITKNFYSLTFFQQMLYEYFVVLQNINKHNEIRSLLSTTNITDHILELLIDKVGTSVVCTIISYSTVKDRKRIIRSYKGYVRSGLLHKDAYLSICRLIQLIDDTVLLNKNILNELLIQPTLANSSSGSSTKSNNKSNKTEDTNDTTTNKTTTSSITTSVGTITTMNEFTERTNELNMESSLLQIALSDTGSKFLRLLLLPNTSTSTEDDGTSITTTKPIPVQEELEYFNKIFDPYERSQLFYNPIIYEKVTDDNNNTSTDGTTTNQMIAIPTSKKDNPLRRIDLLKTLYQPIIDLCCTHTEQLLRSIPGSMTLRDVFRQYSLLDDTLLIQSIINVVVNKSNDTNSKVLSSSNSTHDDGDTRNMDIDNDDDDKETQPMKKNEDSKDDGVVDSKNLATKINTSKTQNRMVLPIYEDRTSYLALKYMILFGTGIQDSDGKEQQQQQQSTKKKGCEQFAIKLLQALLEEDKNCTVLHEMLQTNRGCLLLVSIVQVVQQNIIVAAGTTKSEEGKKLLSLLIRQQRLSNSNTSNSTNIKEEQYPTKLDKNNNKKETTTKTTNVGKDALMKVLKGIGETTK